jgi:polyribonucleotide nucleotidyltransferase
MSSKGITRLSVEIAGSEISFETGRIAKQAGGAVVVRQGDTMVLATATAGNLRDADFLPLTVDVEERMYAAGKIPGSFFKREGRAGEKGTLTARMIDRPIRPLFPKSWRYETQLVAIPLSVDHVHPYDILAMNGASAALMISDIPLAEPVGAVRIGKVDGNFVVNPREEDLLGLSDLDLTVAGTADAILMVEAGAKEIPEAEILDALDIAHSEIKKLCALQRELAEKVGKPKLEVVVKKADEALLAKVRASHGAALDEATQVEDKLARQDATKAVEAAILEQYAGDSDAEDFEEQRAATQLVFDASSRSRSFASGSRSTRSARRPSRERDSRHHDRGRCDAADPRLGAVHARPDAGPERRSTGHAQGGDAPRHARARDQEVLLAPLQLPAVLGRGGGSPCRPEAA